MEDNQIVNLYFDRSEQAIKETDTKYGGYCYSITILVLLLLFLLTACIPQTDIHQDTPAQVAMPSENASQTEQVSQETTVVPTQVTEPSESVSQTEEIPPETTATPTQPSSAIEQTPPEKTAVPVFQNDPVRSAFQRILQTIHDELYWPELPHEEKIELCEPGTIEDEEFAVFDVDGDGQEVYKFSLFKMESESCMQAIFPIFAQAEFWRNAKKDRQTRGSTMLSIGVV